MALTALFVRFEACQTHQPLTHHTLRLNDFTEASLELSTMSAAQRDLLPLDDFPAEMEAAPFALKEQVAQRLAAHRARRHQPTNVAAVTAIAKPTPAKARSARIAATVAERYANSPSYRAFLAAEAENAIREAEAASREAEAASREAEAAARVAAISAQAIADAQYELLAELDQWSLTPPPASIAVAEAIAGASTLSEAAPPIQFANSAPTPGLTVRLYEEVTRSASRPISSTMSSSFRSCEPANEAEGIALDEEIAFRQAPVFDEFGGAVEIPANLIEFPRQLVAARRARPRLAEGPLREDADQTPDTVQLRIFEVEAAQISTAPATESVEPEWSSILLAAHPVSAPAASAGAAFNPIFAPLFAPQTAPLTLRLMASIVDGCIVAATFLAFVATFAVTFGKISANHPAAVIGPAITLQIAAIGSTGILAFLALLYQLLFFTFSDATPGMRYARIGLCTFSDDNPTRSAMRRRIFAVLLAACPLGIGFLWAWLDEEGLGWHDRISRMYQRSY
jgi:uncharacterized RDD family membrane protein YckC